MRRTVKQIENDFISIRKFVKANPFIISLKQIAIGVELTESQIRTSLEKHPRVYATIKQLIDENTQKLQEQKLAEKETIKAKKQAEKEELKASRESKESELEAEENAKNEAKEKTSEPEQLQEEQTKFVLDASISGIQNFTDIFNKIHSLNGKIVLTNITIKELDKLQRFNDTNGNNARKILSMAAGNLEDFMCIRIDETEETADDCIIKYCSDNKENVVLLTSDKTMALTARTFGVKTHFFKQTHITKSNYTQTNASRANTLYAAKQIGNKLFISNFTTPYRSIIIVSNGVEFNCGEGVYELNVGDDVYLATKKEEYLTFAHYHITSLNAENNCKIVFSRRIYDVAEIEDLPVESYKSFMWQFYNRVNS